jgi:methionine salvage enolase-phosphatase E1
LKGLTAEAMQGKSQKEKKIRGIDWSKVFRNNPELSPPGYDEVVAQIKKDKEKASGNAL